MEENTSLQFRFWKMKATDLLPLSLKLQEFFTGCYTFSMVRRGQIFNQGLPFNYTYHFKTSIRCQTTARLINYDLRNEQLVDALFKITPNDTSKH